MTTMPLHHWGIEASQLALGCMGFAGSWEQAEPTTDEHMKQLEAAVDAALSIGINFFDHADIYKRGKSEALFGKLLASRPSLRDEMIIQSKCGIQLSDGIVPNRHNFSKEHILSSVEGILERLGTDYIDILLLHRPDPLVQPEEVAEAIHTLKASGKVRHFGVSNMHSGQIKYLRTAVEEPFIVNQLQMSLTHTHFIDQGLLYNRNEGSAISFEYGLMEYMQLEKIQIQAWGPLEQGRLTSTSIQHATEAEQLTAQYIAFLAEQKQTTREAIALAWLIKHPASIQPVLGTTNASRILACQDAARQAQQMTRDEWWTLYATSKGTFKPQLPNL